MKNQHVKTTPVKTTVKKIPVEVRLQGTTRVAGFTDGRLVRLAGGCIRPIGGGYNNENEEDRD